MDTSGAAATAGSHPAAEQGVVEVHSIDYVPLAERHGRVWYQGPFWFMGNFVLATLAVGFIGPESGLSLSWTILAILIGCLFGTFFMAFHAVQGPRMGLPQMIQSRAQFGYQGAVFPLLAVVFVYVGFNVFDTIFAAQGLDTVANAGKRVWYPLITVLAIAIAVVGHDLLHFVQRWLSYLSILVFGMFTIGALTTLDLHRATSAGGFSLAIPASFLTSFNNFLLLMLYFLVPWTAVNLVDFYFVRRGHYAITEIFNPRGLYGRWGWRGVTAYFVGLGAMVPFMSTTIWTGPAASAMSGAYISFLIGLPVAGGLYYLLTRNLDLDAERAAEQESRRVLEGAAAVPTTAPATPVPDSEPDLEGQV